MSDRSARTIAAAIVLASVVAAVGIALVERRNDERHYERMLFECLGDDDRFRTSLGLTMSLEDMDDLAIEALGTFNICRGLVREVTK
jgi:hypothetical protein